MHGSTRQLAALESFASATAAGTAYAQLCAAREVDATAAAAGEVALDPRQRALVFEAQTLLALTDMRFATAVRTAQTAAESWRGAGVQANELAMHMAKVTAQIGQVHKDTLSAVPLATKLDHLLTALGAAEPTRRQLVEGHLEAGFAGLAVDRLPAARALFARAATLAGDDIERGRALGASALCELQSGNERRARAQTADAIALARSTGDRAQLATLLVFLAGIRGTAGETAEALETAEEAADVAEALGEVQYASALRLRGMLRVSSGRALPGCVDLERSIALLRDSAWQHTVATEVLALAQTLVGNGEHARAEQVLSEHAGFLDETTGDQRAEIDVLRYSVAVRGGRHAHAAAYAENVADLLAAAHHKDAFIMFEAAADAWTLAQEPAHARRCRDAAHRLRA